MKNKKQYIVFGIGRFGGSIAKALEENGGSVCVADRKDETLATIADYVTNAIRVDLADSAAYEVFGDTEYDCAIIGLGEHLEAAIHAVMWASEHNIPLIIAKARNEAYGKILKKLGAHRIIYPEREMAIHLANSLIRNTVLDSAELAEGYSISDIAVPRKWAGKTLRELNIRKNYSLNIIGIKKLNRFIMDIDPDGILSQDDILVALGHTDAFRKLEKI